MIEIIPIAITSIDWDKYLLTAQQVLGRSVSDKFDSLGQAKGLPAFLISLQDFQDSDKNRVHLRHASVSFLGVMMPDTCDLLHKISDLVITETKAYRFGFRAVIISGNLDTWSKEIIEHSKESSDPNIRLLFNKCQLSLEAMGLGLISLPKTRLHDSTFKLLK